MNTDTLPGYNLWRVTAQVNVLAAGDVTVQGELYRGATSLGTIQRTARLAAGVQPMLLDFAGPEIAASRLDGHIAGDPGRAALRLLARTVEREALVLTYNDVLMVMGGLFVFGLLLLPLVGRPRSATAH